MNLKHRIKRLERRTGLNRPILNAVLINPTDEEIKQAHRQYPNAKLLVLNIGQTPTGARIMSARTRIKRLEAKVGGKSDKHYLWVRGCWGESREAAINRYLTERNIKLADVGYIWLWCEDGEDFIDFKNYTRREDLIGYHAAMLELRAYLDACDRQSLGPPCLRPGAAKRVSERTLEGQSASGSP